MGIDVRTFASRAGSISVPPGASDVQMLEAIEEQAFAWAAKIGLKGFFYSSFASKKALDVELFPAGQAICSKASKTRISVECRTSDFGPGYHAAVIDLLDHLAQTLGLIWSWSDGSPRTFDETDYAVTRNFAELQQEHCNFFVGLMEFGAGKDARNGAICILDGLGQDQEGLATPLVIMPNSWLHDVVASSDAERLEYGRKFFTWWQRDLDAIVFEDILRYLLWQHVEWRAPLSRRD